MGGDAPATDVRQDHGSAIKGFLPTLTSVPSGFWGGPARAVLLTDGGRPDCWPCAALPGTGERHSMAMCRKLVGQARTTGTMRVPIVPTFGTRQKSPQPETVTQCQQHKEQQDRPNHGLGKARIVEEPVCLAGIQDCISGFVEPTAAGSKPEEGMGIRKAEKLCIQNNSESMLQSAN